MSRKKMEGLFITDKTDYDKLSKKVQDEIDYHMRFMFHSLVALTKRCESPIEQLLAINLHSMIDHLRDALVIFEHSTLTFKPQYEVQIDNSTYRLDFLIAINVNGKDYLFAIECDGHDFHEKTKEQAARDKKRDRDLTREGYTVIRFTGLEVWKDPTGCARQIYSIISKETGIDEAYDQLIQRDLYS